jgi:molybdate transport system permease protein
MQWDPLLLSFQIALTATVVTAVIGISIGATLALKRFRGRDILDVLITAPMVLPPTVLGYYVLVAIGRKSIIGRAYESLFDSPIVFTRTGATIAAIVGSLPLVVKASRAALEGVDPAYARAARTLGASPMRAFFTVQLPLAMRGVLSGMTLGFARALGDFGVTLMVAGDLPGETQTGSLAVYDAIQANQESRAAGMIAVMSAIAIVALYTANKLLGRRDVH